MAKWRDHEIVTDALAKARSYADRSIHGIFQWELNTWADGDRRPLESPIETAFYMWWIAGRIAHEHQFRLEPQKAVSVFAGAERRTYRLDFAVEPLDKVFHCLAETLGYGLKVAIELDGHEFHERTKEQVAARNQRDRDLQASEWKVFHVSGSELFRDGERQIEEIVRAVSVEFHHVRARIVKDLTGKAIGDL